jgi:hypothetical protein
MYRGSARFTPEQIVFVAECILAGALDMIESALPTSIEWSDRIDPQNHPDGSLHARRRQRPGVRRRVTPAGTSADAVVLLRCVEVCAVPQRPAVAGADRAACLCCLSLFHTKQNPHS